MSQVVVTRDAGGKYLSAVRHSYPSGTNPRCATRFGRRLLVTGSIHYTVKLASAVSRRRRKFKTVHAQRPDQIPPRAFHASLSLSRAGGNPAKNKAHHLPLSRSPNDRRRGAEAQTTANRPRGMPAHSHVIPAQAGTQRKTKHAIYPPSRSARGPKRPIQAEPKGPTRERVMPGDGRGLPGSQPLPPFARYAHPAISQHAREQQWFRNRLHVRVSRRPTASGLNCAQIDKQ